MNVRVSSVLSVPLPVVWSLMRQSSTLVFITKPIVTFAEADNFPEEWEVGVPVQTNVVMFGIGAGAPYEFTFTDIDTKNHTMVTDECGAGITRWQHIMEVEALTDTTCRYTDRVVVTPKCLARRVQWYYQYRHWRWRSLLRLHKT